MLTTTYCKKDIFADRLTLTPVTGFKCHFQKKTSSQSTENRAFQAGMNTSFLPEEEFIGCEIPEVQFIVFWVDALH